MPTADAYAAVLRPKVGLLPDAILVERLMVVAGATEAEAKAALGLTVDPLEFVITVGPSLNPMYSRRGSDMIGAVASGSLQLPSPGGLIDRIRRRSSNDLAMNAATGVFTEFVAAFPAVALRITRPNGTAITLVASQIDRVGGGFIDWDTTTTQDQFIAGIVAGEDVTFRFTFE